MDTPLEIISLVEVPEVVTDLAHLFVAEWEPYYGEEGAGDAEKDLSAAKSGDTLPIYLVGLVQGQVVGCMGLADESISHPELKPWVVASLVAPDHRGKGYGTELAMAIEDEARRLGFEKIYVSSAETGILDRRGWQAFDEADSLRGPVGVYELKF